MHIEALLEHFLCLEHLGLAWYGLIYVTEGKTSWSGMYWWGALINSNQCHSSQFDIPGYFQMHIEALLEHFWCVKCFGLAWYGLVYITEGQTRQSLRTSLLSIRNAGTFFPHPSSRITTVLFPCTTMFSISASHVWYDCRLALMGPRIFKSVLWNKRTYCGHGKAILSNNIGYPDMVRLAPSEGLVCHPWPSPKCGVHPPTFTRADQDKPLAGSGRSLSLHYQIGVPTRKMVHLSQGTCRVDTPKQHLPNYYGGSVLHT